MASVTRTQDGDCPVLIQLDICLDLADGEFVWWASSDQLPGFAANASTLSELRAQMRDVLPGVAADLGVEIGEIRELLISDDVVEKAANFEVTGDADQPHGAGVDVVHQRVLVAS